ncbi:MAG TPA: class I SAM-dependent methyltransferase [Pedobacter sp.]|uniref:class I SAM-dependent methyltransferase n=1 Tax=Pedobacter sp. TaxID=1411316 RepID=UPI002B946513|nr:class I SAM-dependent methyltransferase [Pedobacter sp.]HMI02681.1 class I SAM-dependent methyltransferase [Pedobacter sp.]
MNFFKILVLLVLAVPALKTSSAFAQKKDSVYTYKTPSANGTGKVYMGREIAGIMSFDGMAWLERNSRSKEENTDLAISRLPVSKNGVVADIGAGSGFYTFRIAPKVSGGKVYAVEIQDDAVAYLKNKATELKTDNVTVIKGAEKSPNLPDGSIDLAIMVDVYHELLYPKEFLQAIKRALKSKGKLLLLEYKQEDPAVAIKPEHKMSVSQVEKELTANGFHLVQNGQFMPIQHFLVFEKLPK